MPKPQYVTKRYGSAHMVMEHNGQLHEIERRDSVITIDGELLSTTHPMYDTINRAFAALDEILVNCMKEIVR